ncbi:MAG: hypothetical protein COC03_00565 [Robiginitomaculum sp.]|nr:MAG: hypothetical protein COC03_00565 [Robiginitomaculum sp.]
MNLENIYGPEKPTLLKRMRESKKTISELLRQIIQHQSRPEGHPILVVEGADDVTFYETMIKRVRAGMDVFFIVSDGKGNALDLRLVVKKNKTGDLKVVKFAVDKDFDNLRGQEPGDDLYCTPTYSIENLLVETNIFKSLMNAEYRCAKDSDVECQQKIVDLYEKRFAEFCTNISEANHLIYLARTTNNKLSGIDESIKKYVRVSLNSVTGIADFDKIAGLVGYAVVPSQAELDKSNIEFSKLNPPSDWRGKFFMEFFRAILRLLKKDRGAKVPVYFEKKQKVTFDPGNDMFRALSSIASIPSCLEKFILAL